MFNTGKSSLTDLIISVMLSLSLPSPMHPQFKHWQRASMINVTKTFLPPLKDYTQYLEGIWDRSYVTNRGPLVLELEEKLKDYLGVEHLLFVSNGTIALQIAIKALKLSGEIITTPFSYVATTTSILWENCQAVFADIDPKTFCIDPERIENVITEHTTAILATHVYGYPCAIEQIQRIADKYNLKVIYDGAHAFGTRLNNRSLLSYGDISTLSFHATKLFHTVEGGAIICKDEQLMRQILLIHQFGHLYDDYFSIGVNAKNSEMHAAMGLCNLPHISRIITERKGIIEQYDSFLKPLSLQRPLLPDNFEYNGAYYPVVFKSEADLLKVKQSLTAQQINTRRYFFPSLNELPYVNKTQCPVSESVAERVLCLPLYVGLPAEDVSRIAGIITNSLS